MSKGLSSEQPHRTTITLSRFISSLREPEGPQYRVVLVSGRQMQRENIIVSVEDASRSARDTLVIQLEEDITTLETGFSAHIMKILAQEANEHKSLTKQIGSVIGEYLSSFEVSEVTKKVGFNYHFFAGKEKKLIKKVKYEQDIQNDFFKCLTEIQELQWKTLLAISSVEEYSRAARLFTTKFLRQDRTFAILGGPNEESLKCFVDDLGLSDPRSGFLPTPYLIPDDVMMETEAMGQQDGAISEEVSEVVTAIVNAFATESRRFSFLKFETHRQLLGSDLATMRSSFDTCIIGHLKMRQDYPKLIRTNYNCAILVKVLHHPISSSDELIRIADLAYEILFDGIVTDTGERFDPWDAYIFLVSPEISDSVVGSYKHLDYRNISIFLKDGTFRNLTPHPWLDVILASIARRLKRSRSI